MTEYRITDINTQRIKQAINSLLTDEENLVKIEDIEKITQMTKNSICKRLKTILESGKYNFRRTSRGYLVRGVKIPETKTLSL